MHTIIHEKCVGLKCKASKHEAKALEEQNNESIGTFFSKGFVLFMFLEYYIGKKIVGFTFDVYNIGDWNQ